LLLSAGSAAINRYLLFAGPTAANLPHVAAAVDRLDRQTDGRTPYSYIVHVAYYSSSVNKIILRTLHQQRTSDQFCHCWISVQLLPKHSDLTLEHITKYM